MNLFHDGLHRNELIYHTQQTQAFALHKLLANLNTLFLTASDL